MVAGVASEDAVIAVGIEEFAEVLVCLNERLRVFVGVLRMNIVVGCAVADEECAVKLRGTLNGIGGVTVRILLRCAHVALCIYRVVILPVGRRSYCHAGTEDATTLAHTHQSVEATVAPSPDADAVLVDVRQRTNIESGLYLVLRLQIAEVKICALLKL